MNNSIKARVFKEAILAIENDEKTIPVEQLSLECVIAAYYLSREYFNRTHLTYNPIDLDDPQLLEIGIQSGIIELLYQVGITISTRNSLTSISKCIDEIGDDSITYFLKTKGDNGPMLLDVSIQLISKLNWRLNISSDELRTLSHKQDNIKYTFPTDDILEFWKHGALFECVHYYNQSVRTITNLDLKANSLIVETFREMLNDFSVSQIQKTTFNSCNFALRITIEKRTALEEFNTLFINYYKAYFRKASFEGWEKNIKGFEYRFMFLKKSPIIDIIFRRVLKIDIDPYQLPINENSLEYIISGSGTKNKI